MFFCLRVIWWLYHEGDSPNFNSICSVDTWVNAFSNAPFLAEKETRILTNKYGESIMLEDNHQNIYIYIYIYLVGGFKHFLFSLLYRIILPIDVHIFQRGGQKPPTRYGQILTTRLWRSPGWWMVEFQYSEHFFWSSQTGEGFGLWMVMDYEPLVNSHMTMGNHHVWQCLMGKSVNQLFLWSFSIALCMFTRPGSPSDLVDHWAPGSSKVTQLVLENWDEWPLNLSQQVPKRAGSRELIEIVVNISRKNTYWGWWSLISSNVAGLLENPWTKWWLAKIIENLKPMF